MKKLLLSLCVLCLLVCGCSKSSEPSNVVESFLKESKNKTNTNSLDDLGLGKLKEEIGIDEETLKTLINSIGNYDYVVNSEKVDGDTATVNVTISTYDFGGWITNSLTQAISQAFSLAFSGETSEDAIKEVMNKVIKEQTEAMIKDGKTKKATVDIICKKDGDEWVVDEKATGEELADALSGGLVNTMKDLESQLEGMFQQ